MTGRWTVRAPDVRSTRARRESPYLASFRRPHTGCIAKDATILSPETVGPAADVYAFGCVAYFLLTGRTPFDGDSLVGVCAAHVHDVPEPLSTHAPEVPPEFDALVLRCLEKKPEARPTTRELEAALAG
jgi:serine/threonine protein kinase